MADFLGIIVFAVMLCMVLASIPLVLKRAGFFDFLGKTKVGSWLARRFGSNEPSVFALNMVRVFFFLLIVFYVITGISTDATNYQIHKAVITQMESCNNSFQAVQVGLGSWSILCEQPLNLLNNSFGTLNLSV